MITSPVGDIPTKPVVRFGVSSSTIHTTVGLDWLLGQDGFGSRWVKERRRSRWVGSGWVWVRMSLDQDE
ncbi:hypothetical protein HanIR_Chr04g0181221 [Helianthus annuus]|nr:hypothetical protein HanIR_Chr04g0181221 [Helianthus annuus]